MHKAPRGMSWEQYGILQLYSSRPEIFRKTMSKEIGQLGSMLLTKHKQQDIGCCSKFSPSFEYPGQTTIPKPLLTLSIRMLTLASIAAVSLI